MESNAFLFKLGDFHEGDLDNLIVHSTPYLDMHEGLGGFKLLETLFSLLKKDKKQINNSAILFARIVHAIMNKRLYDLICWLTNQREIIEILINSCYNSSLCEVLSRIVRFDRPFTGDDYFTKNIHFLVRNIKNKWLYQF